MATVSTFSSLFSLSTPNSTRISSHSVSPPLKSLNFQLNGLANSFKRLTSKSAPISRNALSYGIRKLRAAEDETQIAQEEQPPVEEQEQQTVSVPVSPSDTLTMFFQADGMMNEASIPAVTAALEGTEGIEDLKVKVVEGIASVELTKQTTVQATGVASGLVELIQGAGFKLQTLNLSFADEEDVVVV